MKKTLKKSFTFLLSITLYPRITCFTNYICVWPLVINGNIERNKRNFPIFVSIATTLKMFILI